MKKTLCLGLAALLLLSACTPGEGESPSTPVESPPAATVSPPAGSPPASTALPGADTAPPAATGTPSPAPEGTQPPAGGGVWTDWSALEPYEPVQLLYRRWYEEPVRELRAIDGGYGVLVPYVGSAPPDMSWGGVYEYGLMTTDGTIVVDTVYSNVGRLARWADGETVRLPVLTLMISELAVDEEYGYSYGEQRYGAAALDGSWDIPTEYDGIWTFSPEGFFLWDEDTVYVFHTDGQLLHSIPYANTAWQEELYDMKLYDGILANLEGTTLRLIDLEAGESVYVEGISELGWPGDGFFPVRDADSGLWGCVDQSGAWVIPAQYHDTLEPLGGGSGLCYYYAGRNQLRFVDREGNEYDEDPRPPEPQPDDSGGGEFVETVTDPYTGEVYRLENDPENVFGWRVLDENGNVLGNSTADNFKYIVVNGLFLNIDGETAGYKDRDGNWVFRIPLAEAGD